ncbi:DUF6055 domain-containing protein [Leptospira sp. B5-022]|uniref:DUF6055 domain-containing protein n=1 Tax=unclassified Leptospira TaxID=2633828 RepID=UPI0002BFE990|nr:DUF6055 domain-containing protein [Leptospira sp. B5-022]EMK01295.1 peptidase MA family protein [Leptospira sp. B5-022]MCR1794450.1 hypothetical protein [Leptospira sp. id769339]
MRLKNFQIIVYTLIFVSPILTQGQAPKVDLAYNSDIPKFILSSRKTAPSNWEEFDKFHFPNGREFVLKIPNKAGYYTGPDGGTVYQWSPGFYKWDLKDGTSFLQRSADEWALEKEGVKIYSYPKKCPSCQSEKILIYPDNSQIRASFYEVSGKLEYLYENLAENKFFRFTKPGRYGNISEEKDRFLFEFEPKNSLFVHAFTESKTTPDFFKKAESDFDLKPSSRILVAFFQDTKSFREFNNLAGIACSGGRGGIYGISFCDPSPEKDMIVEDPDPEVKRYQHSTQPSYMVYHEITHHMQQIRCGAIRTGKNQPPIAQPAWLVEGHAEFIAHFGWPKHKGTKYREYYENFILKKSKLQLERSDPYLAGFLAMDFISQKYGNSKIRDLWDKTCEGESIDSALRSVLNSNVSKLQSDLLSYLGSETKDLPAKFLEWEIIGTITLPFAFSEASSFKTEELAELINITDPSSIPDIRIPFSLKVESLKGKVEGVFQSPRKERVYLFKNGTYRLETPKYQVNVFPDGTTSFTSEKNSITVWGTGTRKWDSGGKSLTYFPPKL